MTDTPSSAHRPARDPRELPILQFDRYAIVLHLVSASGGGSTADAIKCFNYLNDLKNTHGQKIVAVNSSWGGGGFSQALRDSMAGADQPLHICAAGNGNSDSLHYPAGYDLDNIISVAATDHDDLYANFSNYGADWVDLAAPGNAILSTVPKGSCPLCDSSGYRSLNGTSMAAPHVAGSAALIWSKYPTLTGDQVKQRLLSGVNLLSDQSKTTMTNGRLNVLNTMEDDKTPPAAVRTWHRRGCCSRG
ncbi:MAG: S8 family serine peptidase [Caldilineaceae bacterium]|nr:S8 family serine peptidase [Caldilineaceae bacterium]